MNETPTRPPRRDSGRPRGEPVMDAVLAHTIAELAAHGPEQVSVERVARAAQVNKTSIYRRWPTREALVAAALERVAHAIALQIPDTGAIRGDLMALGRTIGDFLQSPAGRGLARAALAPEATSAIVQMARGALQRGANSGAAEMVARAMARGEWRPDATPPVALSMLVGAILHRVMLEADELSEEWLAAAVDVLCAGVQPRD